MTRHVSLLRRMLRKYPARKWKIEIDGEDILDRYILWEAMNIRSIGPVLYLASQAATKDGRLDFVCVWEEDRSLFMEYLDARLAGGRNKFPLPLRRFRQLKFVWENSTLHFDDKLWPRKNQNVKSPSEIEITVKPSALLILQPMP
jgi:diacylglycerol kinase family enzyme